MAEYLSVSDFADRLVREEKVIALARENGGDDAPELLRILGSDSWADGPESFDWFIDGLEEWLDSEATLFDQVEIEYLTSFCSTATVEILEFRGIFWVKCAEMMESLRYFSSVDEAKKAIQEEFGIDWGRPEDFGRDTPVSDLPT